MRFLYHLIEKVPLRDVVVRAGEVNVAYHASNSFKFGFVAKFRRASQTNAIYQLLNPLRQRGQRFYGKYRTTFQNSRNAGPLCAAG
jgi:hypothetical protein